METTLPALTKLSHMLEMLLVESGGEITPEIDELLKVYETNLPEKVDGYGAIIERSEMYETFYKNKALEFQRVARSMAALREKLKNNLKYHMQTTGQKEISGNDTRFVLSPCKPRLEIDEKLLPDAWKMEVRILQPDKERIEQAVNNGEEIPGVTQPGGFSLRKYLGVKK